MSGETCALFFPGTRPELLPKAIASGADLVCVDLEDAVADHDKAAARSAAIGLLESHAAPPELAIRANHPSTPAGRADLEAIAGAGGRLRALTVMVPKVESPAEVDEVRGRASSTGEDIGIIAVIETAAGLAEVESISRAGAVASLLFGGLDLSIDLGCALDWEALLYARSRCVHAARLGGVGIIDTPFFDVEDPAGLRREAERSRRLGFTGKAVIHPSQVPIVREVFTPTDDEVDRARRVVEASERESGGAFLVDGVMVDKPAVDAARKVVARARAEEG